MTYRAVLSALNEKKAIIQRTDDDHWLYEPISEAVDLIEELQVYKQALEMACNNLILEEIANDSHCGESVEELENMYLELAREQK